MELLFQGRIRIGIKQQNPSITTTKNQCLVDPDPHGSGIRVPEPDPAKMEEQLNKKLSSNFRPVNSGLNVP